MNGRQQILRVFALGAVLLSLVSIASAVDVDVVDSRGKLVGTYNFILMFNQFSSASAARRINNLWFQLPVLPGGFAPTSMNIGFTNANCAGTAYILGNYSCNTGNQITGGQGELIIDAISGCGAAVDTRGVTATANALLYYASGPQTTATICSQAASGNLGAAGNCSNVTCSDQPGVFPMATFDLSTLGLVPPFHLKSLR
jgi:hypothetical protein